MAEQDKRLTLALAALRDIRDATARYSHLEPMATVYRVAMRTLDEIPLIPNSEERSRK
jgi:hypothetical protein